MSPRIDDGSVPAGGPRMNPDGLPAGGRGSVPARPTLRTASPLSPAGEPVATPLRRIGRAAAQVLILVGVTCAAPAAADTIYLANGRVIHTESVRVDGDRVIFRQFGGEVSIPLTAVVRIVEDDTMEHTASSTRSSGGGDAASTGGTGGSSAAGPGVLSTPAAPGARGSRTPPEHPSQQADYWIKRIREVDERIARVQAELDRLPEYDQVDRRLLRFSGQARYFMAERDKWKALLRRFQTTRRQLYEGARKAGITPGALREGLRR